MNSMNVTCPHCGADLTVDPERKQAFCQFCGAALSFEEPSAVQPVGTADAADLDFVNTHLIDSLTEHENYFKYFTKKEFEPHFYEFKRDISLTFEAMERYVLASPEQRDSLLHDFACRFLDDREAWHQQNKLWALKKNSLLFDSKLIIALYLVPAVLDMNLSVSDGFVKSLHEEFLRRYPKDSFEPATYEQISEGFRGRKLCFITTAVCEFEGKPDDCAELQTFRAFRDGYLAAQPDGTELIEEYYRDAPRIVTLIDLCDDREAVYGALRREYLSPCYAAIGRQDFAVCKETYIRMVRTLQKKYGLS